MASTKERNHDDLKEIENHCRTKMSSKETGWKRRKINFRRTAKRFSIKNGQLLQREQNCHCR